jgi:two-component system, OmpR family, response regulator
MTPDVPKRRVLLVEDDKLLWTFLQAQLSGKGGFDVTVCTDGQQAVDALVAQKFDIALLDLVLPGKDGFAILKEKQDTQNKDIPVFVVTNLRSDEHMNRAIELGAKRFYPKAMISVSSLIDDIRALFPA